MTIPVSTVPAAITYIFNEVTTLAATLAAGPTNTPVLVVISETTDMPPDVIAIGTEVRRKMVPHALVGSGQAGYMEEVYEIDCIVSSWTGSGGEPDSGLATAVMVRAWTLASCVETAVRTDLSLGGAVVEAYPSSTSGGASEAPESGGGLVCEITVTIMCTAII